MGIEFQVDDSSGTVKIEIGDVIEVVETGRALVAITINAKHSVEQYNGLFDLETCQVIEIEHDLVIITHKFGTVRVHRGKRYKTSLRMIPID